MTVGVDPYKIVRNAYQNFHLLQTKEERRAVFSALAALYSLEEMEDTAFETGIYYKLAREVKDKKAFKDHPESLNLLDRVAGTYQRIFEQTRNEIVKAEAPPQDLKKVLSDLRRAHISFMNAYIEEYERVYPESADVVCVTYNQTIQLFMGAIAPDFERFKSLISDGDSEIFPLLPKLAIEKLLKDGLKAPELFESEAFSIEKIRETYGKLPESEKGKLHLKLLGDEVELEKDTLELFKAIEVISYSVQRGNRAETVNLVFRETLDLLKKL